MEPEGPEDMEAWSLEECLIMKFNCYSLLCPNLSLKRCVFDLPLSQQKYFMSSWYNGSSTLISLFGMP